MGLLDSIRSWFAGSAPDTSPAEKVGLALGGGSLRGLAHIGVLQVLEEEGYVPDLVTGTSMGAIIGAAWCSGMSAREIEDVALGLDPRTMTRILGDLRPFQPGLVGGDAAKAFLRPYIAETFADLRIPFSCVCTDLRTGARHIDSDGDLLEAVRRSFSIPVLFEPVEADGALYVDGGLSEPVPIYAAREQGATAVVGVCLNVVYPYEHLQPLEDHPDLLTKIKRAGLLGSKLQAAITAIDVMGYSLAQRSLLDADLAVEPDVAHYGQFEVLATKEIIEAGRDAMRQSLDELHALAPKPLRP